MAFNRKNKKKRIISVIPFLIVLLCSVTVFSSFVSNISYAEDTLLAFVWPTSTPKPSPIPTEIPTDTPRRTNTPFIPTPTASPSPSPRPTPTQTPIETETPDPNAPTPSPTPEPPKLPNVAIPGLDYPPTPTPAGTADPNATPEPEISPSPSPIPTPTPEPEKIPTWSGFVDLISKVAYIAAVITAIYALVFFVVCVLFKKEPVKGFGLSKKKKKKKKKGQPEAKQRKQKKKEEAAPVEEPITEEPITEEPAAEAPTEQKNEAPEKEDTAYVSFVRHAEEEMPEETTVPDTTETEEEPAETEAPVQEEAVETDPEESTDSAEDAKDAEIAEEIAEAEAEILTDIAGYENLEEETLLLHAQAEEEAKAIELAPPSKPKTLTFLREAMREDADDTDATEE